MKLFQFLVIIFVLKFNCYGQISETIANKNVDTFINHKMKTLGIPGMAVAVVKKGKIIKISTYGIANVEWNRKVTEHTNFQIASCTKLLTSTLLIKTIYKGKLKLTDSIEKYIDSIPPEWKKLQIKHLISHSSGLREFNGNAYATTAEVVKALKDSTLEYVPGYGQHYAQADFMLMGYILEKLYGKSFTQILHDEIAVPLKMKDGGYDMEEKVGTFMRTNPIKEKVTTYYDLKGKLQVYKFIYPQFTYTAGGYFASINDMAYWAIGLDKEILFTKTFSQEYIYGKDSISNQISNFTRVGWALENENGILYAGHSGGPGLGDVWRFPKGGYTFIVLTNDGELLPNFARALASFYIKDLSSKLLIEKFER